METLYDPLLSIINGRTPDEVKTLILDLFYGILRPSKSFTNVYTFSYDLIRTDFAHAASHLCRGLFTEYNPDEKTWRVICCAFTKFFNAEQKEAATVDWNSAKVQEKWDGSLLKLYFYKDKWIFGTNNVPNALDAPVQNDSELTFGHLAEELYPKCELNPEYCYSFELIHPNAQNVVIHNKRCLIHLGTRRVSDGREFDIYDETLDDAIRLPSIEKPELYPYRTFVECKSEAMTRPEGFVICDKDFNRIKVKSAQYVLEHQSRNNVWTEKEVLRRLLDETIDDYIGYFPTFREQTEEIIVRIRRLEEITKEIIKEYPEKSSFVKAYLKKYKPPTHTNPLFYLIVRVYRDLSETGENMFTLLIENVMEVGLFDAETYLL